MYIILRRTDGVMKSMSERIIQTVDYNQQEIIENIIKLYIPSGEIDIDPTYSTGNFYKNAPYPEPLIKLDINPKKETVKQGDSRRLPLDDNSVNSIIFDPPFLATTGPSLKRAENNNVINKRFGVYQNEVELHQMYLDSLKEFYRVLKVEGILIFKCQDKISSGKQYMTHTYVMNMAEEVGFYALDLFVLVAKNRIIANWQKNQKHARKFHSYFWVFQKCKNQRKMTWEILRQYLK